MRLARINVKVCSVVAKKPVVERRDCLEEMQLPAVAYAVRLKSCDLECLDRRKIDDLSRCVFNTVNNCPTDLESSVESADEVCIKCLRNAVESDVTPKEIWKKGKTNHEALPLIKHLPL